MNERGELFTLDEQLNAANKECDELIEENTKLQAQVSSLTKERDELKDEIDDLNYRAEEDERTIINHEKKMDGLKSLLSKAEEENKKLKEQIGTPDMFYYPDDPELPHGSIEELMEFADIGTPTLIKPYKLIEHENEWCIKNEDGSYPLFKTEQEALASLQSKSKSKGEEE